MLSLSENRAHTPLLPCRLLHGIGYFLKLVLLARLLVEVFACLQMTWNALVGSQQYGPLSSGGVPQCTLLGHILNTGVRTYAPTGV